MSDSDLTSLSSLSPPPPSDDELDKPTKPSGLARYFTPASKPNYKAKVVVPSASPPPPPKREPSPPHEFRLIDNDAIAVIVMFRSRFSDAFSRSCPHFGPAELEAGVRDTVPTEQAERLLCSLLGLCLNRKKDPEREHYGRALEEAVQNHANQWPRQWEGKNPLHGGGSFKTMTAEQRLLLLRTLVYWSLSSSTAIQAMIKESYKRARHEDDRNQPLSVQPWGRDGYKRKYWLIEGQDDTHFQIYRENNGVNAKTNVWFGVAGTIDELKVLATKLEEEGTQHAKQLQQKIISCIPIFEAGEDKRRRRDYRLARKAAFARPDPGFSLYEGRTRGKKVKYTFSDDEDYSDALSTRRSTRHSGISTPVDLGPVVTASGRQVKARQVGIYGESLLTDQRKDLDKEAEHLVMDVDAPADGEGSNIISGRPQRSKVTQTNGWSKGRGHIEDYNSLDENDSEVSDEHDWEAEDEEEDDEEPDLGASEDEAEPSEGSEDEDQDQQDSLVVQLRYHGDSYASSSSPVPPTQVTPVEHDQPQEQKHSINGNGPPGGAPVTLPALAIAPTSVAVDHTTTEAEVKTEETPVAITNSITVNHTPAEKIHQDPPTIQATDKMDTDDTSHDTEPKAARTPVVPIAMGRSA